MNEEKQEPVNVHVQALLKDVWKVALLHVLIL